MALSSDGKTLALGCSDTIESKILIYSLNKEIQWAKEKECIVDKIYCYLIMLSPNGNRLAVGYPPYSEESIDIYVRTYEGTTTSWMKKSEINLPNHEIMDCKDYSMVLLSDKDIFAFLGVEHSSRRWIVQIYSLSRGSENIQLLQELKDPKTEISIDHIVIGIALSLNGNVIILKNCGINYGILVYNRPDEASKWVVEAELEPQPSLLQYYVLYLPTSFQDSNLLSFGIGGTNKNSICIYTHSQDNFNQIRWFEEVKISVSSENRLFVRNICPSKDMIAVKGENYCTRDKYLSIYSRIPDKSTGKGRWIKDQKITMLWSLGTEIILFRSDMIVTFDHSSILIYERY